MDFKLALFRARNMPKIQGKRQEIKDKNSLWNEIESKNEARISFE